MQSSAASFGGAEMITFLAPPLMCLSCHSEPIPSTQCNSGLEGIGATWRPLHHRPVTSARAHSVTLHKRTRNKAGQYGSNGNVGQVRLGCKQLGLGLLGEDTSGPNKSIDAKSACSWHGQHPAEWPTAHTYVLGRLRVGLAHVLSTAGTPGEGGRVLGWATAAEERPTCRLLHITLKESRVAHNARPHDGAQGSTFSWKTAISTPLTTRNLRKGSKAQVLTRPPYCTNADALRWTLECPVGQCLDSTLLDCSGQ